MKVIPAVDIKGGKCVRLAQGRADQETVYSEDPVAVAREWDEQGADLLHVVDLDGAFGEKMVNTDLIKEIISSTSGDVQVGGGIRTMEDIETYINAGACRIILGTVAQKEPAFVLEACKVFSKKIMVGIDAREGYVAIKGWEEVTDQKATDLACAMEPMDLGGFIFTDISRDGMLKGPNLESIKAFAEATSVPVIASGGVSNIEDIKSLLPLTSCGLIGVIIGKALYDKSIDFKEAKELAASHAG